MEWDGVRAQSAGSRGIGATVLQCAPRPCEEECNGHHVRYFVPTSHNVGLACKLPLSQVTVCEAINPSIAYSALASNACFKPQPSTLGPPFLFLGRYASPALRLLPLRLQ